MTHPNALSSADFEKLRVLETCLVSNAIERLDVRLRNEGFITGAVRCQFPHFPPMLGYAVPTRIRTSSPPIRGCCYHHRMDWWEYVASIPEPRVIVVEDVDERPGMGALVGEIHAAIALALQCTGYVTNGAVRDLPSVEALGFQMFAGNVAVSHSYAHIVEFGRPVEIGGLNIRPGDLLHGDLHGVLAIPLSIAPKIPEMAAKILSEELELIGFCRSSRFSLPGLSDKLALSRDGLANPVGKA